MDLKKLDKSIQLIIVGMVVIIFVFLFGFVDAKYIRWMPVLLVVAFVPVIIKYKPRRKTKIEKFYDEIIKNTANEKGAFGDPTNNLRLKSLKLIEKDEDDDYTKYTFKMGTGNSRSQYEKYKEGLEQFLDAPVEFSFDHNLIIKVLKKPLDKYK